MHRSAMLEALADEANATAAQPLSSPTQRAVLIQLLRRWVEAPPTFFKPPPFSTVRQSSGSPCLSCPRRRQPPARSIPHLNPGV
jgi:hypothetical protein